MTELLAAFDLVGTFKGVNLAARIAFLEAETKRKLKGQVCDISLREHVTVKLMNSAVEAKRASGQIDVIVHAVGTLLALPDILEDDETIESLSLGAGNTGRSFDVETNRRIAEFTFIDWKGGSESIRKQKAFKDFYCLAEAESLKRRFIYVLGDDHAQNVFRSRSTCKGMLRKYADLQTAFVAKYGASIVVHEYFELKKHLVEFVNLRSISSNVASAF
jgi:hypothetical protein